MYLKSKTTGDLVEVLSVADLTNPCRASIPGRYHAGEEMPEPETFTKADLLFPSGEALPVCWTDPSYKK